MLVKVTDMGICANPAAHNAKSSINIRQFVPEYVLHNVDLTEKVCLVACTSPICVQYMYVYLYMYNTCRSCDYVLCCFFSLFSHVCRLISLPWGRVCMSC